MESKNLYYRRFNEQDLDILCEMESDHEVMKFTGPARAQSYDESKSRLQKVLSFSNANQSLGFWAPIEKCSARLIGWFMLIHTEDMVTPEIGFMIHKKSWGKGYASEACQFLCDLAKQNDVKKISARTDKKNVSSIRVLEKNDFKKIGEDENIFFFEKKL